MGFLPLVPGCRRLRDAAKAHAAGEMERVDYRALRRRIIIELDSRFAAADGSAEKTMGNLKTVSEITRRRAHDCESDRPTAAQVQTEGTVNHGLKLAEPSKPTLVAPLLLIFLTLVLLVVSGNALARSTTILPLRDRAPNPDQAAIVDVQHLRIEYSAEMPGLDKAALNAQASQWLAEARAASQPTAAHGFTATEVEDLAALLARLGVHSQEGLDESAVAAINAMTRRQQLRRGVSVVQLEQVAQRIQASLRQKGWLVASAFLPAQEVQAGEVRISVLPGQLAQVLSDSDTRLARAAQESLASLLNAPLRSDELESIMYRLNHLPGVRAQGSLAAGSEVGASVLNLRLDNQRRVVSRFRFDDLGDERSARFRLEGALDIYNPLLQGDLLSLAVEQRYDSQSGTRGSLNYQIPIGRLGDVLSVGAVINGFSVERLLETPAPDDDSDIDGQGSSIQIGYDRVLIGNRQRSLGLGLDLAWQDLELGSTDQTLWWLAPRIGGHWVLADSRWVLRGQSKLTLGRIASGAFFAQPDEFVSIESRLSAWHPLGSQSVRLNLVGQLGSDDLPDSLKLSLGGIGGVRGLRPGSFSADKSLTAGIEFTATPARFRSYGELLLFGQWARGQRELIGERASARSWELGVGWRLPSSSRFSGELRFAVPFNQRGLEANDDDPRLLFRLHYRP